VETRDFVFKVSSSNNLWALYNAGTLRQDYKRLHRDLVTTFTTLIGTEQLVGRNFGIQQLVAVAVHAIV
jgi:hypothetical protein